MGDFLNILLTHRSMLPESHRPKAPEETEFIPLPEDTFQVHVSDINLKTKHNAFRNEEEEGSDVEFLILDEGENRGRRLWKWVRPIMAAGNANNKPSWLYVIASKALGREFTAEEVTLFSANVLIGKQLRAVVNQPQGKNGKTYNNIVQFQVKKADMQPFESPPSRRRSHPVSHERGVFARPCTRCRSCTRRFVDETVFRTHQTRRRAARGRRNRRHGGKRGDESRVRNRGPERLGSVQLLRQRPRHRGICRQPSPPFRSKR